jgi:hypothetical protein
MSVADQDIFKAMIWTLCQIRILKPVAGRAVFAIWKNRAHYQTWLDMSITEESFARADLSGDSIRRCSVEIKNMRAGVLPAGKSEQEVVVVGIGFSEADDFSDIQTQCVIIS